MALKDPRNEAGGPPRTEGHAGSGYPHGKAGRIDINDMGDYLLTVTARVPGRPLPPLRRHAPPPLVAVCAPPLNELEHERKRQ